jgi:hypothetical protein
MKRNKTMSVVAAASGIVKEVLATANVGIAQEVLTEYPVMPLYDLATECVRRHTEHGCMFAPDTMDVIRAAFPDNPLVKAESPPFFKLCSLLDDREIFCLDEGIDRRMEFGIAA